MQILHDNTRQLKEVLRLVHDELMRDSNSYAYLSLESKELVIHCKGVTTSSTSYQFAIKCFKNCHANNGTSLRVDQQNADILISMMGCVDKNKIGNHYSTTPYQFVSYCP